MSTIALDRSLRAKLSGLDEHMEVQDESGKVVGHFVPDNLYMKLLYCWAGEQFNEEEHQQAMAQPGGYTDEAIAYIEKAIADASGQL